MDYKTCSLFGRDTNNKRNMERDCRKGRAETLPSVRCNGHLHKLQFGDLFVCYRICHVLQLMNKSVSKTTSVPMMI